MASWNEPPPKILEAIFRWLPVKDKLSCSAVCRRWNKVTTGVVPLRNIRIRLVRWNGTDRYELLDKQTLLNNNRSYRNVEISWNSDCSPEFMQELDSMLAQLPQYALRNITINATPDQLLAEFFRRNNDSLMSRINELTVRIHSPLRPCEPVSPAAKYCYVNAKWLGSLTWTDLSMGNTGNVQQIFSFDAPNLLFVQIQTTPHWPCFGMLNLNNSSLLRRAELDLPNHIWRNINNNGFSKLDVLHFADKSEYLCHLPLCPPNYFRDLFRKMEHLRFVQMAQIDDTLFRTVCTFCLELCSIKASAFEIQFKSLIMLGDLKMLKFVSLHEGVVVGPSSTLMPLGAGRTLVLDATKIHELVSQLIACERTPKAVWDIVTGCYMKYSRAAAAAPAALKVSV